MIRYRSIIFIRSSKKELRVQGHTHIPTIMEISEMLRGSEQHKVTQERIGRAV